MSRIKPFTIEFIDPDTMNLVTTEDGDISVNMDSKSILHAYLKVKEPSSNIAYHYKELIIRLIHHND